MVARPSADERKPVHALSVTVSRRERFNAAHRLFDPTRSDAENERLFGKCARPHGHNYAMEAIVRGDIDAATGYVMDLKELSALMREWVIAGVDHRDLNTDVPWLRHVIPSAENLALAFWRRLQPHMPAGVWFAVRVWETDDNWAECAADR
jgi:6-pyruvoyltetrahydropterin/6-carboxytetrahydropterin synthase